MQNRILLTHIPNTSLAFHILNFSTHEVQKLGVPYLTTTLCGSRASRSTSSIEI